MQFRPGLLIVFAVVVLVGINFAASGFVANTSGCGATGIVNGLIDAAAYSNNGSTANWTFNKSGVTTPVFNQTGIGACINIQTSNIVFDLNGSIIQLSNGAASPPDDNSIYGILITNGSNNVTIKNGYINMSDNFTINSTAYFYGIRVNGSANVTIVNVSITSFGYDAGDVSNNLFVTSVAINITNVSHNSGGYINITNVSISNVTTGGIKIENSTGINISYVMFNAGGSPWNNAAYAIGVTNQNATEFVNITYTLFNSSTNVSMLFYSNLSIYLQPGRPNANAPTGTSNSGGARTFLDKMINLTGASTGSTVVNITFWFNSTDISSAPDTTRLAVHAIPYCIYTPGVGGAGFNGWSAPFTTVPHSSATTSITALNVNCISDLSALVLLGDTSQDIVHSASTTTTSRRRNPINDTVRQDVPNPALAYDCENNIMSIQTEPELRGGTIRMQYYCSSNCGVCNGIAVGARDLTISGDGTTKFDYPGPGEYQLEVANVGSSDNYIETVWYNPAWSCYNPETQCSPVLSDLSVSSRILCPHSDILLTVTSERGYVVGANVVVNPIENTTLCRGDPYSTTTSSQGTVAISALSNSGLSLVTEFLKQGCNYNVTVSGVPGHKNATTTFEYSNAPAACRQIPPIYLKRIGPQPPPACAVVLVVLDKDEKTPVKGANVDVSRPDTDAKPLEGNNTRTLNVFSLANISVCSGISDENGEVNCCNLKKGAYQAYAYIPMTLLTKNDAWRNAKHDFIVSEWIYKNATGQPNKTSGPEPPPPQTQPGGDTQGGGTGTPGGQSSGAVSYNIITEERNEVNTRQIVRTIRNSQPCISCTVIVRTPDREEIRLITDNEGETRFQLLNKGTYSIVLLNADGEVVMEKTVLAELPLSDIGILKKSFAFLDDQAVRAGLIIIIAVIILAAVYLRWRKRSTGRWTKRTER